MQIPLSFDRSEDDQTSLHLESGLKSMSEQARCFYTPLSENYHLCIGTDIQGCVIGIFFFSKNNLYICFSSSNAEAMNTGSSCEAGDILKIVLKNSAVKTHP